MGPSHLQNWNRQQHRDSDFKCWHHCICTTEATNMAQPGPQCGSCICHNQFCLQISVVKKIARYTFSLSLPLPSKMSSSTIHRFDPFTVRSSSDQNVHLKIQEVIYYTESRFWAVLHYISKAGIDQQPWMQKLLHRELVCLWHVI